MISNKKSVSLFRFRRPTLYPSELIALVSELLFPIEYFFSMFRDACQLLIHEVCDSDRKSVDLRDQTKKNEIVRPFAGISFSTLFHEI
jgi:hypothetical protein